MKLSSTISSSSSSSNFDSFPYSSKNERTAGCYIAKILRRILCISSLPSSPFDHFEEEEKKNLLETPLAGPGLVARLMGLETGPPVEPVEQSSWMNSDDQIRKSRSMRSRKIIPTYEELEDDKFFILSFDHGGENAGFPFERWRSHSGSATKISSKSKKKRSRRGCCNKENEGVNNVSDENLASKISDLHVDNSSNVLRPLKDSYQKLHSSKKTMKMKGKQASLSLVKLEAECDPENSSPNSVLDFVELPDDHSETANLGEISRLANVKLRRTLSEELENYGKSKERKLIKDDYCGEKDKGSRLKNQNQNYAEYWEEIGKMAAREIMKSSWLESEISKSFYLEEIGRYLASEILDQLLGELLID